MTIPIPAGTTHIEIKYSSDARRLVGTSPQRRLAPHPAGARPRKPKTPARSFNMIEMLAVDVKETLRCGAERTERALERLIPAENQTPASIHRAMRHSVFAGGKRLRPVLCIEAARMIAGLRQPPDGVEELGAAIEMLHTYSLIHDDLPALDNDDLRRGKPTCHVVFGEAIAILAGDALQTQAYEVLASLRIPAASVVEIVRLIAQARHRRRHDRRPGPRPRSEHHKPTAELVDAIHRAKTGALIRVSLVTGAIYGGATPEDIRRLTDLAAKPGSPFRSSTTSST